MRNSEDCFPTSFDNNKPDLVQKQYNKHNLSILKKKSKKPKFTGWPSGGGGAGRPKKYTEKNIR